MKFTAQSFSKCLLRAGAVLVVAVGASACSTTPDWVDPTTWIGGGDNDQASAPTDENGYPVVADSGQTPDNGQTPDASKTANGTQTADNGQTPDLSTIPDKPQAPSTADEQKDVSQSLASDRARAQYSADALRGGTEPAAAPPPTTPDQPTEELASGDDNAATPPPEPAKPAGPPPRPAAGPGTLPVDTAAADTAAAAAPPPQAAPTTQVASAETAPPAAPMQSAAAAAVPAVPAMGPQVAPSDAALGFRPSTAPPLDASVAQFVPQPILSRYQQTASIGPQAAVPSGPMPDNDVYALNAPGAGGKSRSHKTAMGVGGPESMSGAVVANFDSLQAGSAASPAMYAGGAGAPAAVVFFPHDTTVLNSEANAQVREAAKAFLARGGQGYVKVIGHSSSRTSNMPMARHLVWNFERSQARASAVARALIREGVPAQKVLIEAVGDDHPVYYESMPQGEDGNRRAEIFFQS